MTILNRFGRRLAIPSTRQIRHELVMFGAREEARLKALEPGVLAPAVAPALDPERVPPVAL